MHQDATGDYQGDGDGRLHNVQPDGIQDQGVGETHGAYYKRRG
jgi:hypothetical protein